MEKEIAIYKLDRIEQALDGLSRAVDRLDAATIGLKEPRDPRDGFPSSQEEQLRREIEDLRANYQNLLTISDTVSRRVEKAIVRVRGVLGS
ncbi:hypothetical protein IHV25_00140 [Phaeovibrio sulfidiphilus]|uniref:Uncharacterized protein n=1 Tax=Phaeovibrio sulfidiphilus TaxID=1220600 RepID=A0A8J6YLP5_9PROT|nr:hypothetical protein [Phaeovibrio sulfidiphilus]MBE1236069.1 hypothetical protein [Phaeovibrio sulfidiphilus]